MPDNGHVILGGRKFTCKKGHEVISVTGESFRIHLEIGSGMTLKSGPICPICALDFMAFKFPQWPADETIEEAIANDHLNKNVEV